MPNIMQEEIDNPEFTRTGTPADNFPDASRAQFCGTGEPKSTRYIQEYSIPTECTNPLAIVTDYDGNVWFTETNTGSLGKFDPATETFTEYANPSWPPGARSMMWGIDYAPDGSLWFTDEAHDSVWEFSTIDEEYRRISYPSEGGDSLPQRLQIDGSQMIINDFTGNKISFLELAQSADEIEYLSVPSPFENSFTADFAIDKDDNVWYTNWLSQQGGVLLKFDYTAYRTAVFQTGEAFLPTIDHADIFELPPQLLTPNGIEVGNDGRIWLADTSSSSFFSFDPSTEIYTQYVTAEPMFSTYGNQTGIIKNPVSRPYWMQADDDGRIVFNAHTSNNISVMNPQTESLVEYHVPSKNPYWADCDPGTGLMLSDCGMAQVFGFTVDGPKVWFTEWVENNIGVVDTSVPLPAEIQLESDSLTLEPGGLAHFDFTVSTKSQKDPMGVSLVLSPTHDFIDVELTHDSPSVFQLGNTDNGDDNYTDDIYDDNTTRTITTDISASEDAPPGTYKVLIGLQTTDVAIGKFVTVTIE